MLANQVKKLGTPFLVTLKKWMGGRRDILSLHEKFCTKIIRVHLFALRLFYICGVSVCTMYTILGIYRSTCTKKGALFKYRVYRGTVQPHVE